MSGLESSASILTKWRLQIHLKYKFVVMTPYVKVPFRVGFSTGFRYSFCLFSFVLYLLTFTRFVCALWFFVYWFRNARHTRRDDKPRGHIQHHTTGTRNSSCAHARERRGHNRMTGRCADHTDTRHRPHAPARLAGGRVDATPCVTMARQRRAFARTSRHAADCNRSAGNPLHALSPPYLLRAWSPSIVKKFFDALHRACEPRVCPPLLAMI